MQTKGFEGLSPCEVGPLVAAFVQPIDIQAYPGIESVAIKTGESYQFDMLAGAHTLLNSRIKRFLEFVYFAVCGARGRDPVRYRAAVIERYATLSNDMIHDDMEMFDYKEPSPTSPAPMHIGTHTT